MTRRVVVTGMGAISPLGNSVQDLYANQLEGKSGMGPITHFDASQFPTKFAAQVRDYDLSKYVPDPERFSQSGYNTHFAFGAAHQALEDAGLLKDEKVDRTRFGVYLAAGEGSQDYAMMISIIGRSYDERSVSIPKFAEDGLIGFNALREYEQEMHTAPGHVAAHFGLEGPNYNCLTACAAGSQAVGEALELIRCGDADLMLCGGAHSMIHPFGVTGFNLLTALSTFTGPPHKASRPFDLNRDGFVLGEGAGMIVLEELEHARKRGARIHAELTGYGSTADSYRMTDSHPEGRGAIACVRLAMKDARLNNTDIGYINAHGTSTQVNDQVETLTVKKVFGDHAYQIPMSSSKSMLGHLIAAAGAVEFITCVKVLHGNVLPPTINYETPDPDCDLDYVPNVARPKKVDHILSNSFGFGGQNISLIVSRFTG